MMDCSLLIKLIERHDIITIFRHENPDCDAMGSQYGLRKWIEDNYDNKIVFTLGHDICTESNYPESDTVDNQIISDSLAIVLDTANPERIDDQRYMLAETVVKVDHHPNHSPFGDYILVNDKAAATCEILAHFFASQPDKITSTLAAGYLYEGLLTDTLCFKTNNTTPETLLAAAYLAGFGLDLNQINRNLFDQSFNDFCFATYIRDKVQITEGCRIGFIILEDEDLRKWSISGSDARRFIDELGKIKEFQCWAIFTASKGDPDRFDGSLRSKKILVNKIAYLYSGGGHNNAAGLKNVSRRQVVEIITLMQEEIIKLENKAR